MKTLKFSSLIILFLCVTSLASYAQEIKGTEQNVESIEIPQNVNLKEIPTGLKLQVLDPVEEKAVMNFRITPEEKVLRRESEREMMVKEPEIN